MFGFEAKLAKLVANSLFYKQATKPADEFKSTYGPWNILYSSGMQVTSAMQLTYITT